ncbi:MaoC/PaaZ C-terminal domain-containing protein [Desulfoscipio gibsoniae]|uniref:Acyl dehydratase n=1 Tax=Desulfoscipio gibsoniae DSM 7213 TaxID=767817 RepID=G6I8S1_9FIRM|nr:MaoC/PaaZ C-terminal domain-containing protein [Desulfoscipio gibsoniae]AGL00660.1 acyl dehydratase [Desulfoscipio gibsoniae DSM 7213]AGL00672.1 acyl dehydratase [Desulfoscipio gibsoniae DSM 7213]
MGYQLRGKTFDEFSIGEEYYTASRTITESDVATFAGLSGDYNPLHTDETFMQNSPFGTRIAHGALILSVATGLANQLGIFEGTTIAVLEMTTRFTGAVKFGDTIRLVQKIAEKKESKKADRGVVNVAIKVLNQRDESVLEGTWVIMLTRKQ